MKRRKARASAPAGGKSARGTPRSGGPARPDSWESLRKDLLAEPLLGAVMALEDGAFFHAGGRVLAANAAGARLLGAGHPKDLVGFSIAQLGETVLARTHLVEDLGKSTTGLIYPVRRLDGAVVIIEAVSAPVHLGDRTAVMTLVRDVTEAERTRRALAESEARLLESQRVARMGSWELHFPTGRLVWSEEVFRIFEVDPERFAGSYEAFLALVHPEDRELVDRTWRTAVAERRPYQITHRLLMRDGRVKHVEEQARVTYGEEGWPVLATGTVQDVSERMRLEQQLLLAGRAVASSPAATAFAGLDGRITSVNEAFLRLTDYRDEGELVGRHAMDLSGDAEVTRSHFEQLAAGRGSVGEVPVRRRDGSIIPTQIITSAATDAQGRIVGLMAQFVDLSERKEAARRLTESEARYRRLYESMRDAFVSVDMGGRHTQWNPAYRELLGYGDEELGRLTYQDLTPPAWHETERRIMAEQVLVRGWSDVYEKEYARKDGTVVPVELRTILLRDEGGSPVATWSIVRDVTERRRAADRIAAQLAEKDVLLREVHHRVKNNLQVISSLLRLQEQRARSPEVSALLREAGGRVAAMALVHERLYSSVDLTGVDFAAYARDLALGLISSFGSDPGRVLLSIEGESFQLDLDRAITCGLILNELVSNALKHAFPGGRSGRVTLSFAETDAWHEIQVRDDGVGMPPEAGAERPGALGLLLLPRLAAQLGATLERLEGPGTAYRLRIPGGPR